MSKGRRMLAAVLGLVMSLTLLIQTGMEVRAEEDSGLHDMRGGVASLLNPGVAESLAVASVKTGSPNVNPHQEGDSQSTLVMANVKSALNVRSEANENADKVGKLYKDCGGLILERRDGWTKLQSGNIIGWASDEFLLFGDEARMLANDVGKMIAMVNTEAVWVRMEPSTEAGMYGLLPKGEIVEVLGNDEEKIGRAHV